MLAKTMAPDCGICLTRVDETVAVAVGEGMGVNVAVGGFVAEGTTSIVSVTRTVALGDSVGMAAIVGNGTGCGLQLESKRNNRIT
jgi:hypothetical protein